MAREVHSFAVTVTSGTTSTAPATTEISTPVRVLRSVTVTIPAGCSGLVGFRLGMADRSVIPVNADKWIIGDNRVVRWDVDSYPESGAWQVTAYNTDSFDHTLYWELEMDLPGQPVGSAGVTAASATTLAPSSAGVG
jgi:hypothetical protein